MEDDVGEWTDQGASLATDGEAPSLGLLLLAILGLMEAAGVPGHLANRPRHAGEPQPQRRCLPQPVAQVLRLFYHQLPGWVLVALTPSADQRRHTEIPSFLT